jgi:uncharacterized membrane protein
MKDSKAMISAAIAGLFALSALGAAGTAMAGEKKPEKCYGIVKAGKNDCQTSSHACAGQVKTDGEGDSWIYVPQGTCEKIVGGTLKPTKP